MPEFTPDTRKAMNPYPTEIIWDLPLVTQRGSAEIGQDVANRAWLLMSARWYFICPDTPVLRQTDIMGLSPTAFQIPVLS